MKANEERRPSLYEIERASQPAERLCASERIRKCEVTRQLQAMLLEACLEFETRSEQTNVLERLLPVRRTMHMQIKVLTKDPCDFFRLS